MIRSINIVKNEFKFKELFRFNAIPIEILKSLFKEVEQTLLKYV